VMSPAERRAMAREAIGTLVFLAALAFLTGLAWAVLS
jgi:hypothetical protein